MKRIMALTALASLITLFAFTTQATAQEGPTASADPAYVSEAGTPHDHRVGLGLAGGG